MKTKIKKLIQKSKALNEDSKKLNLKLLDFLNEDQLKQMMAILENEADSSLEIERGAEREKSQINTTFVATADDFFRTEEKKAIKDEEKNEKTDSENILKKLNDV